MKISIIIPLYNINYKLFERCIKSIFCQTYTNWECVVINDGSNEKFNYLEIIKKYNNGKIKYIEQKNQGLPISRNNGLHQSKGDLIWFVDPDDYIISRNSFNKIIEIFSENNIDFLNFKYIEEFKNKNSLNTKIKHNEGILINVETNQQIVNIFEPFHSVWRNVYKKNFLITNNLYHQNKKIIFEDVYFDLILKSTAKNIYITNDTLYSYNRNRIDSICNVSNKNFSRKINIFVNNIEEAYKWTILNNKCINLFYLHCLYYYSYFPFLNKDLVSRIHKYVKTYKFKINYKQKISFFISKKSILIYIYKIFIKWFFFLKKIINFFIKSYKLI